MFEPRKVPRVIAGESILIRVMSGTEHSAMCVEQQQIDAKDIQAVLSWGHGIVATCALKPDGSRIFATREAVAECDHITLDELKKAVFEVNGLGRDEKNEPSATVP